MKITNWTETIQRNNYVGIISGVKEAKQNETPSGSASGSATVEISEMARQAAMAAEMEKDGISPEAAAKLASGKITINEPDWDNFEVPTLKAQPNPAPYRTMYLNEILKSYDTAVKQVKEYYAPAYSQIQGMSDDKAANYLYKTYKLPYQSDLYVPGTRLPAPPEGMSKAEADMAYKQLMNMRFGGRIDMRDPYALGTEGMKELDSADERARQTVQAAYDAAQKDLDAEQEIWKAQRKEDLKRIITNINNGSATGTCMGYMALRPDVSGENEAEKITG